MSANIEDYALIGDCETAALVRRDGSIDWLCWPRFDSAACFASLLGSERNGRWRIGAADPTARISRSYREQTLVLETEIETRDGSVTVVDFMPVRHGTASIVRLVQGRTGRVAMRTELVVRFDYGSLVPWVTRLADGTLRAIKGPDMVVLRTTATLRGEQMTTVGDFDVAAGDTIPFVLSYGPSHLPPPAPIDPAKALKQTESCWRNWACRAPATTRWSAPISRSLLTLQALTHQPTGGVIAARQRPCPSGWGARATGTIVFAGYATPRSRC
jgi:GH15 family glucan-1,4-alpha-glucosidase